MEGDRALSLYTQPTCSTSVTIRASQLPLNKGGELVPNLGIRRVIQPPVALRASISAASCISLWFCCALDAVEGVTSSTADLLAMACSRQHTIHVKTCLLAHPSYIDVRLGKDGAPRGLSMRCPLELANREGI
jgi:hypothetical protein